MIDSEDEHSNLLLGSWRELTNTQEIFNLRGGASNHPSPLYAREIRDNLKKYFYDEGAVEFQWKMVE